MFSERLVVPWWWCLIAVAITGTFVIAIWAILGNAWAWGSLVVALALVVWALWHWSRATVTVDDQLLQADGAAVEGQWISHAVALDPQQSTKAVAEAARTGDHLVLRPWLATCVRVVLADTDDPHPSWLVSTRRPDELAAEVTALVARRQASPHAADSSAADSSAADSGAGVGDC